MGTWVQCGTAEAIPTLSRGSVGSAGLCPLVGTLGGWDCPWDLGRLVKWVNQPGGGLLVTCALLCTVCSIDHVCDVGKF